MERNLVNIYNEELEKTIFRKGLISKSYLSYTLLISAFNYSCLSELAALSEIVDNELLIELLCNCYGIKRLTQHEHYVKIHEYSEIDNYLKEGYFIYKSAGGEYNIALTNLKYLRKFAELECLSKIYLLSYKDFIHFIENNFSHLNTIKAKYYLNFISKDSSAKNINYIKAISGFCIIFFTTLIGYATCFHIINNIAYFAQNLLKISLVTKALKIKDNDLSKGVHIELPMYTVLIPLYKEEEKITSILEFIEKFNYPKLKLDVKIIVEADDHSLIRKIGFYKLQSHIQIIKVPFSLPRTKPKALNYALQYARGKYIVVYDAEDQPDPDQLIRVVEAFETLPSEYACIQGKLNFYNADENLLTKFFSIEYSLWFNYLLKGLSILDLPVTLGGTSNHFKANILNEIGGWDAYNVTEDADLGIRLYIRGYRVHVIDSYTMEEAPINLSVWLNQRSRWIKGFVQTFFVFLKLKGKLSKLTFKQLITVYIFVGISTYSFCVLPWILLMVIKSSDSWINYIWLINSFFAFAYIYAIAYHILLISKGSVKNFEKLDYFGIILFPFYFLLHTIASYMAIWESLRDPFKWNKTSHGLSSHKQTKNTIPIKDIRVIGGGIAGKSLLK